MESKELNEENLAFSVYGFALNNAFLFNRFDEEVIDYFSEHMNEINSEADTKNLMFKVADKFSLTESDVELLSVLYANTKIFEDLVDSIETVLNK